MHLDIGAALLGGRGARASSTLAKIMEPCLSPYNNFSPWLAVEGEMSLPQGRAKLFATT
jgi:hypothetical protein